MYGIFAMQNGLTPLLTACKRGDEHLVNLLIQSGASMNTPTPSVGAFPCMTVYT